MTGRSRASRRAWARTIPRVDDPPLPGRFAISSQAALMTAMRSAWASGVSLMLRLRTALIQEVPLPGGPETKSMAVRPGPTTARQTWRTFSASGSRVAHMRETSIFMARAEARNRLAASSGSEVCSPTSRAAAVMRRASETRTTGGTGVGVAVGPRSGMVNLRGCRWFDVGKGRGWSVHCESGRTTFSGV